MKKLWIVVLSLVVIIPLLYAGGKNDLAYIGFDELDTASSVDSSDEIVLFENNVPKQGKTVGDLSDSIAALSKTLTNTTFDANGPGNTLSNVEHDNINWTDFEDITTGGALDSSVVASENMDSSVIKVASVSMNWNDITALRGSPKELVSAPGAGNLIEFISAVLVLDAGSEVLTESADNLAIEYDSGSAIACSQTIESTNFIDQAADTVTNALPPADAIDASADIVNKNIALVNIGDGEIAGNASHDAELEAKVTYRILTDLGL